MRRETWIVDQERGAGFTFWVFVLLYSVARFALDLFRYYERSMILLTIGGTSLSVNQGISAGLFVLAWVMLFLLRNGN